LGSPMPNLFAETVQITTVTVRTINNVPIVVALLFGLAGSFFVSIYYMRRKRKCEQEKLAIIRAAIRV